ncbi:MAG: alpha/beta hydrolase, partial [Bacteroidales bacterium]|nr:alpha/beta hydrolase [Bacteroidales bacterium]
IMSGKIDFENQKINFTDKGKGKTIVLLHGFLESLEMWNDFVEGLSADFRVVCIDLPGHGKSPVYSGSLTMEVMARWVKTVLDNLEIKSCVMVGHSMGGYVTLEFARQYSEMLKGFALFHSQASADTEEAKENRRRTINIVKLNKAGFINQFIPDLFAEENLERFDAEITRLQEIASKTPAKGIIAALEAMRDRSGKIELLLNTEIPVLFIAGKEDPRIPVQNVMAQAILPAHSEVMILGRTGHMGYIEARDKTFEMIKCFAARTK